MGTAQFNAINTLKLINAIIPITRFNKQKLMMNADDGLFLRRKNYSLSIVKPQKILYIY